MKNTIYTSITKETVETAKKRAYDYLNDVTNGKADEVLECAKEYIELQEIVENFEKEV